MDYLTELTEKITQLGKRNLSDELIKFYEHNHQGVTQFVKTLKKEQAGNFNITELKFTQMTQLAQFLVDFLSQKKVAQSSLYLQALAALDCLLSCASTILTKLQFSKKFARNLREYFNKICQEYENSGSQTKEKSMQFQFYSVFYILVMFIYQSGKVNHNKLKKIHSQILSKNFIWNLLLLELPLKNKGRKLIAFILVHLVKKNNYSKQYGKAMITFILRELQYCQNKRSIFNYIFCLRQINVKYPLQLQEIQKYHLIKKLKEVWQKYSEDCQIIYMLDFLEKILKSYPFFSRQFFDAKTIRKLGSPTPSHLTHPIFPDIVIQILKSSIEHLNKNQFKGIIFQNLRLWKQNELSLRFINNFFCTLDDRDIITIIEGGYLDQLEQILGNTTDDIFKYQGFEILEKLLSRSSKMNENISINIYYKMKNVLEQLMKLIQMRSSIQRLKSIYQKRWFEVKTFSLL